MKKGIIGFIFGLAEKKLVVVFEKFRVSSPKVAILVFAGLAAVSKGADTLLAMPEAIELLGPYAAIVNTGVTALSMILAALTGTASAAPKTGDILIPGTTTTLPIKKKVEVENGSITDVLNNSFVAPATKKKHWKKSKPNVEKKEN